MDRALCHACRHNIIFSTIFSSPFASFIDPAMVWIPWRSEAYEKVGLDHDSSNDDPKSRTSMVTETKILWILTSLNLTILGLVLFGGHIVLQSHVALPSTHSSLSSSSQEIPISITQCGTTPSEARARGCRFESNNLAWVPPECYDEQLSAEWDAQDWDYALNSSQTPVSKSKVLQGELEAVWVTWGQHIAHCALLVRKYQRAVMFNWPLDNWTSSYEHTAHCAKSYTDWKLMAHPQKMNAVVNLKFPTCGYEWKEGILGAAS